jgi:hypothetical protein
MHDPARARATVPRERKSRGGEALGDVPAGSTRTKKNGTPRAPGRCNVDSR